MASSESLHRSAWGGGSPVVPLESRPVPVEPVSGGMVVVVGGSSVVVEPLPVLGPPLEAVGVLVAAPLEPGLPVAEELASVSSDASEVLQPAAISAVITSNPDFDGICTRERLPGPVRERIATDFGCSRRAVPKVLRVSLDADREGGVGLLVGSIGSGVGDGHDHGFAL